MDNQILDLLREMNTEMKGMKSDISELKSDMTELKSDMSELKSEMNELKSDMTELKSDMHKRFDVVDAKLIGIGGQFELTNEARMIEVGFVVDKVNHLEKELYILRTKGNS